MYLKVARTQLEQCALDVNVKSLEHANQ
jgi:hypothetical protein